MLPVRAAVFFCILRTCGVRLQDIVMVHTPVMLAEAVAALAPQAGECYVDATFGAGGYTRAILEAAPCRVIGVDQDPEATERAGPFHKNYPDRFIFIRANFADLARHLTQPVDGIVADLGVSSAQIDAGRRGFSFQADGPLDMRMDPGSGAPSAAELVNTADEKALADIIYQYGGERRARRVARRIVEERPFTRTLALAQAVRAVVPRSPKQAIDPATRTFQALRIAVNDELGALKKLLDRAPGLLSPGGRLVVVSFHSLEDGIVKSFLRGASGRTPSASRHEPQAAEPALALFTPGSRKVVRPTEAEVAANPRARSARLRWAIRTEASAP